MSYGIDPMETKTIKIKDIDFTIGHILSRKNMELRAKLASMSSSIKKQVSDEFSYDDLVGMGEFNYQIIKYSVKGHSGFLVKDKQVEFKTECVFELGKSRTVVSEETMEYYALNGLIPELAIEILNFINISEQEQKN